jgi:hypothetical protein
VVHCNKFNSIQFKYQGTSHYVELNTHFLYVEARITKNKAVCTADDKVTVSEGFANSCFPSVDMILNDMHIYRGNNLWPYQSHLKDLLTQGSSQKDSELSAGFWYADAVQDKVTAAQNSGYSARLKLTAKSETFDFIKKINIALLEQLKPLAPYTDFTIMLRKSSHAFCLVGPASTEAKVSYEVNITKCVLNIRRLHLHDDLVKRHQTLLNSGKKYLYPIRQADLRSLQIPSSITTFTSDLMFNSVPQFITLCLVTPSMVLGKLELSPFNFKSHSLSSASILIDSELSAFREIKIDTQNNNFTLGYQSLFQLLPYKITGNGIKREDYPNKCILVFELLLQKLENCFSLNRKGQVKIELRFSESTTEPLLCLVLSNYDSTLMVDKQKNVFLDFLLT